MPTPSDGDKTEHMSEQNMIPQLPKTMSPTTRHILLASQSPRRRQLLGMIVPTFDIVDINVDETYPAELTAEEIPAYLSLLKSRGYHTPLRDDQLLITADTVVIHRGEILGKPHDADDACRMLASLSGDEHIVITGVTLATANRRQTFSETTRVRFAPLTDKQIRDYVEAFAPMDKAGAYGIQEWIGAVAIDSIHGCFYNVMGLPLHSLYVHLSKF